MHSLIHTRFLGVLMKHKSPWYLH